MEEPWVHPNSVQGSLQGPARLWGAANALLDRSLNAEGARLGEDFWGFDTTLPGQLEVGVCALNG